MDDVTMRQLCCFLTSSAFHISSAACPQLNRLNWQKAASPPQLCLSRYFLPSILCNICSHFQHFKVMSKAEISFLIFCLRYLSPHFGWQNCTTPLDWDPIGEKSQYFGINPKSIGINLVPSQSHAIPNPDQPPLRIFLKYQQFCTKKKLEFSKSKN